MSGVARFLFGAPKKTAIGGFNVQTSVAGKPIPIVYGTARVAGNLIHMPKLPVLVGSHTSKVYGSKGASGGQTYVAPIVIALCEGPIDSVGYVWRDKDGKLTFVGNYDVNGWALKLGTLAPTAWSYLLTNFPNQAIAYHLTAYVANDSTPLPGDSMSSYSWEVQAKTFNAPIVVDASPADVIPDLLESIQYGLGWSSARIGSLTAFQDYCAAFSLFASPVIDSQNAARDTLNELLEVSNTGAVWSDGVLKLVPYGDTAATANGHTFTPNTTPLYDLTDVDFMPRGAGLDPVLVTRKDPAATFNQVVVEFEDRQNADYNTATYVATDQFAVQTYGAVPMPTLSLHSIKRLDVAQQVAQMRLQREQNIRNTYQFRLGWKYSLLEPMDLVTLTDAQLGLSLTPVRLTVVEELANEQGIECTAEDWPLGTAHVSLYGTGAGTGTAPNANVDPGNTTTPVIFEGPSALQSSPLEIWVGAAGGVNWGGCDVYISVDNTTFTKVGRIAGAATFGTTTATLASNAAYPSVDTTHTLSVDVTASGGALVAQSQQNFDNLIPLCFLGGAEFVDYRDLALTSAFHYDLTHLYRGLYGSTIPGSHGSGIPFVFCDDRILRVPWPLGKIGQVVYFKFPAFNIYGAALQDVSSVSSVSHTIGQDPILPGNTGAPAVPQGTVSIDADGNWGFSADFPNNAQSYRWLEGTGGYPSDAGTASGGAVVNLSGLTTSTLNNQGTLTFGQTAFITIVPFTGASAGGSQMQPIHIRGAYLTLTATKTANYSPDAWQETTRGSTLVLYTQYDSDGNVQTDVNNPGVHQIWEIGVVLPNGVTIIEADCTLYRFGTLGTVVFGFDRKAGQAATSLGTHTVTSSGVFQTVTISLSEPTTGYAYRGSVDLVDQGINQYIGNMAIQYTMGDPKKAL